MVLDASLMISGDPSRWASAAKIFITYGFDLSEGALRRDFLPLFTLFDGLLGSRLPRLLAPIKHEMLSFEI